VCSGEKKGQRMQIRQRVEVGGKQWRVGCRKREETLFLVHSVESEVR
jgi:hypothetical protein